jgi:hypothetical protein
MTQARAATSKRCKYHAQQLCDHATLVAVIFVFVLCVERYDALQGATRGQYRCRPPEPRLSHLAALTSPHRHHPVRRSTWCSARVTEWSFCHALLPT